MCCPEICRLRQIVINLSNQLKEENKKMYKIKLQDYKIVVVCEHCYNNGEVKKGCNKCGGKGTHFKTKQKWEVCKNQVSINKIDRDSNEEIRYWEDKSNFFEESSKLVHFTYKDAVDECKRRNELIK